VAAILAHTFSSKCRCLASKFKLFWGPYEIHIGTDGRGHGCGLRYCVQVKYK